MLDRRTEDARHRKPTGGDLQYLRNRNLRALLSVIWEHHSVSRLELARTTGLAPSTVTRLCQELIHLGLIKETGKGESSGGRQPALLVPNPEAGLVISLDFSREKVLAGIFDAANDLVSTFEQPLSGQGPEHVRQQVLDVISVLLSHPATRQRRLLGIGISLPGSVEAETGRIVDSFNLMLHDFPLKQILEDEFHLPVYIEHDASVAALAEHYYGAGLQVDNFVYILASKGIGSGILLDGKIYRGETGKAGELGHILLQRDGQLCVCGRRGCLEAEAGGLAMIDSARRILDRAPVLAKLTGGDPNQITVEQIIAAAQQGDHLAVEIIGKTADYLGQGISNYALLYDIRRFIVGGELAEAGELFFNLLSQAVHKYKLEGIDIEILPARLAKNTFLRGISMLTLQATLNTHL